MKSVRETEYTAHKSVGAELSEVPLLSGKIALVRALMLDLQAKLELLEGPPTPEIENGIDFYDEVTRFEIKLIRQALRSVRGNQQKAACLLNLNKSTLNTKIRNYRIEPLD